MRILFAGTPEMAVPALRELASRFDIVAVLTAPDREKGRKRVLHPPPVKEAAGELDLPVLQPPRLNAEARRLVRTYEPELLVVVAYGRIFGPKFLDMFPHGGINLHPSFLPAYRGPSPIPAAILAGDTETGITVQRLAREMDSGDILLQRAIPLDGSETTGSLTDRVAAEGGEMLALVVDRIQSGNLHPVPQDHAAASYCGLIKKSDGEIDWTQPAERIARMTRAYDPWPGAFTFFQEKKLTIRRARVYKPSEAGEQSAAGERAEGELAAGESRVGESTVGEPAVSGSVRGVDTAWGILVQTGEGVLAVERLQLQSRGASDWKSFLNGAHGFVGSVLGRS